MEFNKSNVSKIAFALAGVMVAGLAVAGKLKLKDAEVPDQPSNAESVEDERSNAIKITRPDDAAYEGAKPEKEDHDDETLQKMMQEMEKDRDQQRVLKDLRLKKEEIDLKLEEQKAMAELNKIRTESDDPINEGKTANDFNIDIKVVYVGGTETSKTAILYVNGMNYFVRERDRLLKNIEVLTITNNDVTVRFMNQEAKEIIYPFKPE